ncbi:5-amino-6-(5-phosphoribosylamino)uracil reductase [Streptomyces sp. ADI96-02]|nr:5-amino-6-(5-phosphoribosylamino)uracil reductase [Streptomyces sp. ADI96-02]
MPTVMIRYVLLSSAVSIDGHLDTRPGEARLLLSNKEDFDRVDSVRAGVDAVLVGAGTLRADNPRLLVNSQERRAARIEAGQPEHSLKVTITGTGDLDPDWKFWHHGGDKLVLAVGDAATAKPAPISVSWPPSPPRTRGRPHSTSSATSTPSSGSWSKAAAPSTPNSWKQRSPTNSSSSSRHSWSASRTRYGCSARRATPAGPPLGSDFWRHVRSVTCVLLGYAPKDTSTEP